jgi:hypothetical protein
LPGSGTFYFALTLRLDIRTLQHQGSYALSLVRHFAGIALPLAPAPNLVYFNVANLLVNYPIAWTPAIEGVLVGSWVLAVFAGRARRQFRMVGMLRGAAGAAAIMLGMALCGQATCGCSIGFISFALS